ncbi:MAG: hypothetical protein KDC36_06050 [Thermoleophilia bacterium]|nr:hypothetical protein [Thermoleophilia bacterium]
MATVGGPPWSLPVSLLVAAVVGQVVGAAVLLAASGDLARGEGYGPEQLAAVHLLGLAFLTVAIIGALLQLVPVLLRRRLGSTVRSAVAGGAVTAGSWSLALGLWRADDVLIAVGGTLLVAGGGMVVVDLVVALVGAMAARTLGASGVGIALATLWFAATLGFGALMAADRIHPFLETDRNDLIAAHASIAIVGWIGGTILAVALRLAPMFALSHGHRQRLGVMAMGAWHASVIPLSLGFLVGADLLAAAGGVLLLAACAIGLVYVIDVARHRRRRPEAPMVHLLIGLLSAAAAVTLMLVAWTGPGDPYRMAIPAGILALVGFGAGTTSGHLFKVVPMLVWTGRFAHLAGTPGAPRLADLYPAPLAVAEQALFVTGLGLLSGGIAVGAPAPARAGAVLLVIATLAVAAAVVVTAFRPAGTRVQRIDTSIQPSMKGTS